MQESSLHGPLELNSAEKMFLYIWYQHLFLFHLSNKRSRLGEVVNVIGNNH